ncbi:MAG: YceI family protein [Reinekea sp.]
MTLIKKMIVCTSLLTSASITLAANQWKLNEEQSQISFQTTKNGSVVENHTLKLDSGSISDSGEATVTIALNTVQTGIDIRNERIRERVFQTVQFPVATVHQKLNLNDYPEGTPVIQDINANLSLHGIEKPIVLKLSILRLKNTVQVSSVEPVLLKASEFDLEKGIDQLQEIASLDSIAKIIPVSVSMVFER